MTLFPSISKHLEKFAILTDQIIHTLKMSLYASVCNNTVAMWPLFIELIVSFCIKITGKISVTQGKLGENTGNFILARLWPPCCPCCKNVPKKWTSCSFLNGFVTIE